MIQRIRYASACTGFLKEVAADAFTRGCAGESATTCGWSNRIPGRTDARRECRELRSDAAPDVGDHRELAPVVGRSHRRSHRRAQVPHRGVEVACCRGPTSNSQPDGRSIGQSLAALSQGYQQPSPPVDDRGIWTQTDTNPGPLRAGFVATKARLRRVAMRPVTAV